MSFLSSAEIVTNDMAEWWWWWWCTLLNIHWRCCLLS